MFLGGGRTDGDGDDFSGHALFFQTYGFLDGDFAEGVHRHFDVGEIDAGVVRLDADLDVVVDHSLDSYKNLHGFLVTLRGLGNVARQTWQVVHAICNYIQRDCDRKTGGYLDCIVLTGQYV
ncbi:hypothetical protein D3C76_1054430 [compost metagenome]